MAGAAVGVGFGGGSGGDADEAGVMRLGRRGFLRGLLSVPAAAELVALPDVKAVSQFIPIQTVPMVYGGWIGYGGSFNWPVIVTAGRGYEHPPEITLVSRG